MSSLTNILRACNNVQCEIHFDMNGGYVQANVFFTGKPVRVHFWDFDELPDALMKMLNECFGHNYSVDTDFRLDSDEHRDLWISED